MHVRGIGSVSNPMSFCSKLPAPLTMAPALFTCRYCKKTVSRSLQGLKSHISQTPECRSYRDQDHFLLNARNTQIGSRHAHHEPIEQQHQQENFEENDTPPIGNTNERPSKRARVDGDDNVAGNFRPTNVNFVVDYPGEAQAGAILHNSQDGLETRFEKIQHAQQHAGNAAWAPFNSLADWELSHWLVQSGVSQREIDKFLKLDAVCVNSYQKNSGTEPRPRFNLVPTRPHKTSIHSLRKLTASPKVQSGHARSLRSVGTERTKTTTPSLRKLNFGEGILWNACVS